MQEISYGWSSASSPPIDPTKGVAISATGVFLPYDMMEAGRYICEEDQPDKVLTSSIRMQNCRAFEDDLSHYFLIGGCGEGDVMGNDRGFRTQQEDVNDGNVTRVSRSAFFKSFLLPDKDSMTFECDYFVCTSIEGCDGYSCPDSKSPARHKRSTLKEAVLPSVTSQRVKIIYNTDEIKASKPKILGKPYSVVIEDVKGKDELLSDFLSKVNPFHQVSSDNVHKIAVPAIITSTQDGGSHVMLISAMCVALLFLIILLIFVTICYYRRLSKDRPEFLYKTVHWVRPQDPPAYEDDVFSEKPCHWVNSRKLQVGGARDRTLSLDDYQSRARRRSGSFDPS